MPAITRSTRPLLPSSRAQWAQQYQCSPDCTPCPMTLVPQCSQMGAIASIAHWKQSKVCTAPCACTSNAMS